MDKVLRIINLLALVALIMLISEKCSAQFPPSGDVKIVNFGATYRVKVVDKNPDFIIKVVGSKPMNNYEWRFVRAFPDFTIQFVEFGEDFRVKLFNY